MVKGTGRRNVQRIPARSRTRLQKPKLSDPERNSAELAIQLRSLGLRLQNTLGDGNCLFRALSDQLYGSEGYHLTLRKEITDWMAGHPDRYAGFVEDDRGLDEHLRCMRMAGTYGGHLELSAFAHSKKKNIKVIQPGLVYVIEWNAGGSTDGAQSGNDDPPSTSGAPLSPTQEREKRRARREKVRDEKAVKSESAVDTVYVAYHEWEHYSSVRSIVPAELPSIAESRAKGEEASEMDAQPVASTSTAVPLLDGPPKKPRGRPRKHPLPSVTAPTDDISLPIPLPDLPPSTSTKPATPTQIPLPRSPSPSTNSNADSTSSSSLAPVTPSDSSATEAHNRLGERLDPKGKGKGRSPKRLLDDEDDASSSDVGDGLGEGRSAKRRAGTIKSGVIPHHLSHVSHAASSPTSSTAVSVATPSTTPPPSSSSRPPPSTASTSSLSSLEDEPDGDEPMRSPPPPSKNHSALPTAGSGSRVMTRRQRKQLGLPKPRPKRVILTVGPRPTSEGSAAKGKGSKTKGQEEATSWQENGNGRLDVRGFRELKI